MGSKYSYSLDVTGILKRELFTRTVFTPLIAKRITCSIKTITTYKNKQDNPAVIDKFPISRRFVRTKAVQYLYAFHINKQANYQSALEAIKTAFTLDVFTKNPLDERQLEKEKFKALELFTAWETGKVPYGVYVADKPVSQEVATKLWEEYQKKMAQETKVLQGGFQATLDKIVDAYLLILQLIIEWFILAQAQAEKCKQLAAKIPYPIALVHNPTLEALYANGSFQHLIKERHLSWNEHMDIVSRWYNQFIKEVPLFQIPLSANTNEKDYKILKMILEQVVLKQEDIQHFFSILDLGWEENKSIVKKLLLQVYTKNLSTITQDQLLFAASPATFYYTELISGMLERERQIEQTMQQHTQNWSMERIVLLDRIIIKLALCEMRYLAGTPTKVIINEYVDIAKQYSTLKSGAFVNGILDTIAKTI